MTLPLIVYRSLHQPNEKLVELLLTAASARKNPLVNSVTLVAPYLAYMRQDMAFSKGEVVSQRIVGQFLADLFDAVVTVDPHLHRVATLEEAVPAKHAVVISGAPLLADWIARQVPDAMLIGPDEESAQWIAQAADRHQFDFSVCRKVRLGDHHVEIALPDVAVKGRPVVLLDDVASSGHTLAEAAKLLLAGGATSVDVAVTHALFASEAVPLIRNAGVRHIWSTDCIAHDSNVVPMTVPLAAAIQPLL